MSPSPSSSKVLFFSRGRGRGHAIPDIALSKALRAIHPTWEIVFVSYGTGAETFRLRGEAVHDLDLPDLNPYLATLTKALPVIQHEDPDVIIAHEEFAALPAARLLGIPAVFLSAWLPAPTAGVFVESLNYANRLVVLESPGLFATPPNLPTKPVFTGPMARQMPFSTRDRDMLRAKLKLPENARVITVMGSGGLPESKGPLADPVCAAFANLDGPKHLIWVAGTDADLIRLRVAGRQDVTVHVFVDPIEEVLAASDLVITKGTRGATLDCLAVGVPSLAVSFGTNPIDDLLVPRIRSNTSIQSRAVDATTLLFHMERLLRQPPMCDRSELVTPNHVANILAQQLLALLPSQ